MQHFLLQFPTPKSTLFVLLFFYAFVTKSQSALPLKYSPDGVVNTMIIKGDTLIVGGDFKNVGKYTGGGAMFTDVSDQPDLNFPKFIGNIHKIAPDGNGGFYILGSYYRESESSLASSFRIEHLLADYSFEAGFSLPVNNWSYIRHMVFHNGILYIGCYDTNVTINGQALGLLSALNVNTKQFTSWAPTLTRTIGVPRVSRFVVNSNRLYVMGDFNAVNGVERDGIVAFDIPTGNIKSWNPRPNWERFNNYADMVFYKDKIILGGGFSDNEFNKHACAMVDTVSGQNYRYLMAAYGFAEVDKGGLYWGANVQKLAVKDDMLYAYSWGTADTRVSAININNISIYSSNVTFASGIVWRKYFNMIATPAEMIIMGNSLFLMGEYIDKIYLTNQTNQPANLERDIKGGAKLSLSTGNLESWFPDPVGYVVNNTHAMATAGNKIFIGGQFTHVNGLEREGVYMLNTQTETILPFKLDATYAKVGALKLVKDTLFVGGTIDVTGSISNSVFAYQVSTAARFNWTTTKVGYVNTMEVSDKYVFVGGSLTEPSGGANRRNLFAINRATGVLDTWAPDPSLSVDKLLLFNNKLYASGHFMAIAGQTRNRVASFELSDLSLTNWNPNANGRVSAIFARNGLIWLGGSFSAIGGTPSNIFAGVEPSSGALVVNPPSTLLNSPISAMASKGCELFLGGNFRLNNVDNCANLTVADLNTNTLRPSSSFCQTFDANNYISAMVMIGDGLYFGGRFEKQNGVAKNLNIGRVHFPTNYFAACQLNNCTSNVRLASTADDYYNGSYTHKSNLQISASNKVLGSSQLTLRSGSSILLLPNQAGSTGGFVAQPSASGSFQAEIGACN